jgi:hypothetical protein
MPNQHPSAAPYERSYQHRAVADIEVNTPQRSLEILERGHVRHMEETSIARRDLEADGRSM